MEKTPTATPNREHTAPPCRLDGRPRAATRKADARITQARKWLLRAHRSLGSWARVAAVFGLTSKGQAQRIATGGADVPPSILVALADLTTYRRAARWLAARTK